MSSFKILLLAVLVIQNTVTAMLGRYTRKVVPSDELYDISHFILVSEGFKFVVSLLLEAALQQGRFGTALRTHWLDRPLELLKMAAPAVLYLGSNTLLYVAISNLAVPIFQVCYQGKLVVTALVSVVMLGRRYHARQWACLLIISVCVGLIALEENKALESVQGKEAATTSTMSTTTLELEARGGDTKPLLIGLTAVATACLLSALAGVYFEKVIKTASVKNSPPSLWMRNVQLAFFSLLVAVAQTTFMKQGRQSDANSINDNVTQKGFLYGFSPLVWAQVVLFAGGGLLVSAVIKFADNVLKGLATGVSVLLSTTASMMLYHTPITPLFALCAVTTAGAVFIFSNDVDSKTVGPCCSMRVVMLGLKTVSSCSTRVVVFGCMLASMGSIILSFCIPNNNPPLPSPWGEASFRSSSLSLRGNAIGGTGGAATALQTEPPAQQNETDLFPANWNTTPSALQALRDVQGKVVERMFHEATHVLYDLRTHLGDRPVKYLEIGSYTGISSSTVLRHPFPTMATLVDPCVLPKRHFRGTLTQEETIRKNLNRLVPNNQGCNLGRPWNLRVGYSPGAVPTDETFDIIFIDGDHSTQGVWADYTRTVNLLRPGGFMVFDDYLDATFSPAVRPAVDDIVKVAGLIDIGTPRNIHGIHPQTNKSFINEYILQKPGRFTYAPIRDQSLKDSNPLLCVTVATYRRSNGSTPAMLDALWKRLTSQSYTNWELYITGDFYDDETEWKTLPFSNDPRVHMFNMPEPGERGKLQDAELWNNAGAGAMNNAIKRVVADGKEWIVHLDDDDMWDSDHLQNIVEGVRTGATFVMTFCQHMNDRLPKTDGKVMFEISHNIGPIPCGTIHSSIAFNAVEIKTRYAYNRGSPADAYMWARIIYDEGYYPAFVPVMSCHHLREGGSLLHRLMNKYRSPVVRKSILDGVDPPPGWEDPENAKMYHALAANAFPTILPASCKYVIGPETGPSGRPAFGKLTPDKVPYYIRSVKAFEGLTVWVRM